MTCVDFDKAFHSISRKLLWHILLKNGIKGRQYRDVRSKYETVKTGKKLCRLRERRHMSKSVYVRVVHDLRFVIHCAIEGQL